MDFGTIPGLARPVPRMIQGTRLLPLECPDACDALFDAAFAAGCNAFETALVYDGGQAERALGRWLAKRGVRQSTTIVAKGCHPADGVARMSPAALRDDLTLSLDHLRTDHVDLYLLHRDDPAIPVDEILGALDAEVSSGRMRAFGASNWSHERLQQAFDHAARAGIRTFVASSPGFSLLEGLDSWPGCLGLQYPKDRAAFDWYARTRLPLLAWSPLASGFLSGRYTRNNVAGFDTAFDRQTIRFYASEANFERVDRLAAVAESRNVSLARAAIAYVLSFPLDVYAVLGCRDAAELADCLAAAHLTLSPAELAFLHGERVRVGD